MRLSAPAMHPFRWLGRPHQRESRLSVRSAVPDILHFFSFIAVPGTNSITRFTGYTRAGQNHEVAWGAGHNQLIREIDVAEMHVSQVHQNDRSEERRVGKE